MWPVLVPPQLRGRAVPDGSISCESRCGSCASRFGMFGQIKKKMQVSFSNVLSHGGSTLGNVPYRAGHQHMLTSSVAQRRTNNCHFIYDEVNQREKKQLRPWLNIYTMLALRWLAVSQRTFPRAESCVCTRRKQHERLHSYRHRLVFLQDFRLVHDLNQGWFLYKQKEEQKLTSRNNRLCDFLWISGGLQFSAPPSTGVSILFPL